MLQTIFSDLNHKYIADFFPRNYIPIHHRNFQTFNKSLERKTKEKFQIPKASSDTAEAFPDSVNKMFKNFHNSYELHRKMPHKP
jgi:hypothetical protein